jgi:hydroxymethylbilane synthase
VSVLRLGTRGSALALAQAQAVAAVLGDETEVVTITTSGDRDRTAGDKEKWVKELELALLARDIDLAVHSAKDVPTALPEGLALVGAPPRGDPYDALCGAPSLTALPAGARVGTASLRRAAQVRALRGDLEVVELRGNVDTRLGRLARGEVDAAVLAVAGLTRLGREDAVDAVLDELVPAPGQGVIALEAREDDDGARAAAAAITDAPTWAALQAERSLVAALGASCDTPLGAHAVDGVVRTFVGLPDGSAWLRDEAPADEAVQRLLSAGAADLLRRAGAMAAP